MSLNELKNTSYMFTSIGIIMIFLSGLFIGKSPAITIHLILLLIFGIIACILPIVKIFKDVLNKN